MSWKDRFRILNSGSCDRGGSPVSSTPTHERLVRAFSRLQEIELVRDSQRNPQLEKAAEERIVWRELLDLELQAADENIERLFEAAGEVRG